MTSSLTIRTERLSLRPIAARDGTYLGRVGLEQPIGWPEPELGWSFLPESSGKGYATEAARAVLDDTKPKTGVDGIISLVHPDNIASIRAAERLGAWRDDKSAPAYAEHLVYRHEMGEAA